MESFSLLKYWRASSSTATSSVAPGGGASTTTNVSTTTTIGSSASSPDSHTTEAAATGAGGEEEEEEEGGSFFDLEFASVPNGDESESVSESDVEEGEANEKQTFTSLVSLEPLNPAAAAADTKSLHHSPVSLLKSATRLRVFALALNKKLLKSDATVADSPKNSSSSSNFFIEVFTGSRNNSGKSKPPDEDSTEETKSSRPKAPDEDSTEERRFSKDVVHKYINSKIRPLYVRVSRRYGEMRFSGPLTAVGGSAAAKKKKKKVTVKSRSAAVAAVTSMPPAAAAAAVQRRDDSLLQQEDGIQSAIAHCKRSFNASSKETKTLVVDEGEEIMV